MVDGRREPPCAGVPRPREPAQPTGPVRIAWLSTYDWSHELAGVRRGRIPTHRLMGAAELAARGHEVRHLTGPRWPRVVPDRAGWLLAQAWWLVRQQREVDVVVAVHEAAALSALALRRLRILRRPVLVMTVAATDPRHRHGLRGQLNRWALRGADRLTVFASVQRTPLAATLGVEPDRVRFLPLGVDVDFFRPRPVPATVPVLAVGTNPGKDYPTLVRALPADLACVIVTDARNRAAAEAVAAGKQVTFRADVPIAELRDAYAAAATMVVPLRQVDFSSGQTVLLEALAMDRPVIVSDVSGIDDYVAPGVVTLVPPGDVAALGAALRQHRPPEGRARDHVVRSFSVEAMADRIEALVTELCRVRSGGARSGPRLGAP